MLPGTAAGHSNTAPVAHTISHSHHGAHTPLLPHNKQGLQHWVTLQFTAHPVVIPVPPGSSIVLLCALNSAPSSGVLLYLVFHSCASEGVKMEKAWVVSMRERFSSCFPARRGNWTSDSRTGFCSCLPLCHCAAGCHTEGTYARSWWGCQADMLSKTPVTQEVHLPDWRQNQQ